MVRKMNLIVCPIVAGLRMTRNCVESLLAQDIEDVRLLLIDNGSRDGVASYLRTLPMRNVHLVTHAQRRGLNQVWNESLDLAFNSLRLDYVLVVNNDTILNQHTYRILRDDGGLFVTAVGSGEADVRHSEEFMQAEQNVKISHFTRQGLPVRGVVHIGANDGYEIEWYRKMGARVLAFEPLERACRIARAKYQDDRDVTIFQHGLSDEPAVLKLNITQGDGQGSSFLPELNGPYKIEGQQEAEVVRFDSLHLNLAGFNTLVVDAQGMELQVLRGFGERLQEFDFLMIECSRVPLYVGEASAQAVIDYLAPLGFKQDSPIEDHNDIMFIRRGLKLRDRLRPHPDFSCFLIRKECWEHVGRFDEQFHAYCADGSYHLRMHRAGVEAISLPVPFTHIASGTLKQVGNAQRDEINREAAEDRATFERMYGFAVGSDAYYAEFAR